MTAMQCIAIVGATPCDRPRWRALGCIGLYYGRMPYAPTAALIILSNKHTTSFRSGQTKMQSLRTARAGGLRNASRGLQANGCPLTLHARRRAKALGYGYEARLRGLEMGRKQPLCVPYANSRPNHSHVAQANSHQTAYTCHTRILALLFWRTRSKACTTQPPAG